MSAAGSIAQAISIERRGTGIEVDARAALLAVGAPGSSASGSDGEIADERTAVRITARLMNNCATAQKATAIQKIASRRTVDMSTNKPAAE